MDVTRHDSFRMRCLGWSFGRPHGTKLAVSDLWVVGIGREWKTEALLVPERRRVAVAVDLGFFGKTRCLVLPLLTLVVPEASADLRDPTTPAPLHRSEDGPCTRLSERAGFELPAFCRALALRSIFFRASQESVAQGWLLLHQKHTHHSLVGAAVFSSATCFDRRQAITWCPFQLPPALKSSSLLFLSPIIPIVRRVLSAFSFEAHGPIAQIPPKTPFRSEYRPPISALTRRATRQTQG